jgi:hypothetical protein
MLQSQDYYPPNVDMRAIGVEDYDLGDYDIDVDLDYYQD